MHSVIETIEDGYPTAVAVQDLWLKNNILYWPPGKNIDRQTPSIPHETWLKFNYKLLKTSIETFEEALDLEKMYSKHRNSSSFREYQEQQKLKRLHPVNYDQSNQDLIDVNDMVKKINDNAGANEHATFVEAGQASKYHKNCVKDTARTVKKPVAKVETSSIKFKTGSRNGRAEAGEKLVKKPLPFQKNYLKSGISKAKNRVPNVTKPKIPRYDNFLKSAKRFDGPTGSVKPKNVVPSATITKAEYLKQIGIDSDDENGVPAHTNFGRASTPIGTTHEDNIHENHIPANYAEGMPDSTEMNFEKKVNELEDISIRPATMVSSHICMTFEDRVLKELNDLKKTQKSFEARIENRIENFFNDQSRLQGNSQSRLQSNSQSRMRGNYHSGIQYQSRQYGGIRNEIQVRHREPVSPKRYVDDFEDFEELDQNFPVRSLSKVEELELTIRRDLDFKFLLNSRLNELGASKYKKCIRLKMKYLFTDQVLDCYTWRGTEEKSSFQKLKKLNNLILHSVRDRCPKTERDEYKDYMIQWLKHSRSRQRIVTYTYPDRKNRDDSSDEDDGDENNN